MRIMKFGGKSLETKEKMQNIAKFIKKSYKNDKKLIIVVSAMGFETDSLVATAEKFCGHNMPQPELAKLLSTGETKSSALFAGLLNSIGVPARSFDAHELNIHTFGEYTNSLISSVAISNLKNYLANGTVCVVAGFQGVNFENRITTLGRGGSDTTAVALSSLFEIPCEIYSDFDGIFSGDPNELNYKKCEQLNFDSALNLANGGAKVLDSRAIELSKKFNIPIISRCSHAPEQKGTIVNNLEDDLIAVSTSDNLCKISITFSKNNQSIVLKTIISTINQFALQNLSITQNQITFFIAQKNKQELTKALALKLNLLKNE